MFIASLPPPTISWDAWRLRNWPPGDQILHLSFIVLQFFLYAARVNVVRTQLDSVITQQSFSEKSESYSGFQTLSVQTQPGLPFLSFLSSGVLSLLFQRLFTVCNWLVNISLSH